MLYILKIKTLVKECNDIKDGIKVTENEDAIQQGLFDNIMEIGFENVMLSDESREVAAHISGYIAKKLVKSSDTVVKIIVSMSQKQHQQLMSILIFWSRGGLTLPSECLVTYVCDCFAFIDHAINVITSSKMKESCCRTSPQCCGVS